MMGLRRFRAVLTARNREFFRDRTAISWNVLFPVLMVISFAFFFNPQGVDQFKVGLYGERASDAEIESLLSMRAVHTVVTDDLDQGIRDVERHRLDLLLDLNSKAHWSNQHSNRGMLLQRLWQSEAEEWTAHRADGQQVRYIDWLAPGIFNMNIMFGSLFGVGYVIVRYRKNGVLKRLKATPLTALEFLSAQIVSRLWIIVSITVAIYIGTNLIVDFRMEGSYLLLLLVAVTGTLSMVSMSLIVAARLASEEAANGLLNLISLPMLLLSEVWFSLQGSPQWVQTLSKALPLTHLNIAARAVMIDGAGLSVVAGNLLALLVISLLCLLVAAYSFRWE